MTDNADKVPSLTKPFPLERLAAMVKTVVELSGFTDRERAVVLGALFVTRCIAAGVTVDEAVNLVRTTHEKMLAVQGQKASGG
jgi:hypothetical protein